MVLVNYWAVLVSGIAAMVVGGLWYGPILGKQWIASMGWTEQQVQEKMKDGMGAMWKSYLLMFISALLMAFILAHVVVFADAYLGFGGAAAGALFGFGCWLGFVVPATLGGTIWEGKSWKWWLITAGYYLVTLLIMGAIIGAWM